MLFSIHITHPAAQLQFLVSLQHHNRWIPNLRHSWCLLKVSKKKNPLFLWSLSRWALSNAVKISKHFELGYIRLCWCRPNVKYWENPQFWDHLTAGFSDSTDVFEWGCFTFCQESSTRPCTTNCACQNMYTIINYTWKKWLGGLQFNKSTVIWKGIISRV